MEEPVRLQKWLARAGLCSRREGESWIAAGRVAVNGEIVTEQGVRVGPKDSVAVDGKPVSRGAGPRIVLAMHKPPKVICTRDDPEGRTTLFDLLGSAMPRLLSVGRLDYMSEGLILLTNDGLLAHRLMHPRQEVPRAYRARVHGRVGEEMLSRLRPGVLLEEGHTGPLEVSVDRVVGANSWVEIVLREGRNRVVRRIFEAVGMEVSRLIRIRFGGIGLGDLERGRWRPLEPREIRQLRQAAGFPTSGPEPGERSDERANGARARRAMVEERETRTEGTNLERPRRARSERSGRPDRSERGGAQGRSERAGGGSDRSEGDGRLGRAKRAAGAERADRDSKRGGRQGGAGRPERAGGAGRPDGTASSGRGRAGRAPANARGGHPPRGGGRRGNG